jgi:DUF971 family protein
MIKPNLSVPAPLDIKLLQKSKVVEIHFDNNEKVSLSCEYLRVFSPSIEVKGYGSQPGQLVFGKKEVNIVDITPVGHYAVKFVFDDGHNTGIYSWETLYDLAINYSQNWALYLQRLANAHATREPSA